MAVGAETSYVDPVTAVQAEPGAEPRDETEAARAQGAQRDKPPKRRKAKRGATSSTGSGAKPVGAAAKAQSAKLERKLAEVLTFPAAPAAMVARDPLTQAFLIEHFTRSGPVTAAALVEASESNETIRRYLELATTGGSTFQAGMAIFAYAFPPVLWALGMREQAASITRATTMTPAELETMMQASYAAAAEAEQTSPVQGASDAGANGAPFAPEPGPGAPE